MPSTLLRWLIIHIEKLFKFINRIDQSVMVNPTLTSPHTKKSARAYQQSYKTKSTEKIVKSTTQHKSSRQTSAVVGLISVNFL